MKIGKIIPLAASLAAVLMVSGCASKSNNNGSATKSVAGTAFDGPISGGTVCIDVDKSKKCDVGEPSAITDTFGKFDIANPKNLIGALILTGGVDTGTQKPFVGTFSGPVGSTVLNPTTSAIQSLVETGATPADAEKTIKKALNIKSDVPLTSFDPFDSIKNGTATQKTSAQEVLAAQAKLQTIVQSVSTTVAGANDGTTVKDTMASAFTQVAKGLQTAADLVSDGTDVVVTPQLVATAAKASANAVFKDNTAAQVAAKAVADSAALQAVAAADQVSNDVKTATPAEAATQSNKGMIVANTSLTTALHTESSVAKTAADGLSDAKLKEIADAQKAQEDAEAAIAAKNKAAADAAAKAKAAAEAAAKTDATKEQIVAAEEAKKAAADAAAAQATAAKAAADAAAAAAAKEAQIAAQAAAAKAAAAKLAADQAAAAQALEVAKAKAAADAAAAAKAAADAAAAKAAAKAQADAQADAIAQAKAAADAAAKAQADAIAQAKAAADAAAKAQADAAAELAKEAAAKAAAEEKLANACTEKGGTYTAGHCQMSSPVTGGAN